MALEIERKFLVNDDGYREMAESSLHIVQGYLNRDPDATVRIRIIADLTTRVDSAVLTVKSRNKGAVRYEWEYQIPVADAREMLRQCASGTVVDKVRFMIPYADHIWEVDEFLAPRKGLVVAEVELSDAATEVSLPPFVGEEVTGDPSYYNSSL